MCLFIHNKNGAFVYLLIFCFLSQIDHEIPTDDPEKVFRQMTANSMLDIVKLRDIFKVTNPFPYGIF